tara:strand:- start:41 stop:1018 length:978 start_codon:yes stop_codon:yes gene_type:complete
MNKVYIKELLKNKKNLISKANILCIGDIILDHYIHGTVSRFSPEAPIPILLKEKETYQLGGVGNVAKNISSIGGKVTLVYISSFDYLSKITSNLILQESNIKKIDIKIPKFKIPLKIRFKHNSVHLLRVDDEFSSFKLSNNIKKFIVNKIEMQIKKCDLVILSDYSKGLLDKDIIQKVIRLSKKYNKKVIADPKKNDFSAYIDIDLITPNQKEITDVAKKKSLNEKNLINFGKKIIKKYNIKDLLITRSEKGMLLINKKLVKKFKANLIDARDVTGAGDTVIGVLALMLAVGFDKIDAISISNYAASLVVKKDGTETINYEDLIK